MIPVLATAYGAAADSGTAMIVLVAAVPVVSVLGVALLVSSAVRDARSIRLNRAVKTLVFAAVCVGLSSVTPLLVPAGWVAAVSAGVAAVGGLVALVVGVRRVSRYLRSADEVNDVFLLFDPTGDDG